MEEENRKHGRGGRRPGAGRKRVGHDFMSCTFRLSRAACDNLDRLSVSSGKSKQALVNEWAESLNMPESIPLPARRLRREKAKMEREKMRKAEGTP